MENLLVRHIEPSDNTALAIIIRDSLTEFNAAKPGTVYFDETTDRLSELFTSPGSVYFVAIINGEIMGGAGIFPTRNLPGDTCELVKLYLSAKARGKGIGKILLNKCDETAKEMGYKKMYLETMPELSIAVPLYEKMGFQYLPSALGESGHTGCAIWMLKEL
ncbi:MAG: GNAT family N-acetyltransferase [Ferruginibacter sp.]